VSGKGRTAKDLLLEMCVAIAGHLPGPGETLLITWDFGLSSVRDNSLE